MTADKSAIPASDHSLLKRVRAGESDAATSLYLRYVEHLQALVARQTSPQLAARLDPDDIVQSVFRTLFRRIETLPCDAPVRTTAVESVGRRTYLTGC